MFVLDTVLDTLGALELLSSIRVLSVKKKNDLFSIFLMFLLSPIHIGLAFLVPKFPQLKHIIAQSNVHFLKKNIWKYVNNIDRLIWTYLMGGEGEALYL